uniref:Uncharacterized protein n=1 Tax=Alexandrium monilatum TaxID=311494 RepID=A0A7S4Q1M4_9DINO
MDTKIPGGTSVRRLCGFGAPEDFPKLGSAVLPPHKKPISSQYQKWTFQEPAQTHVDRSPSQPKGPQQMAYRCPQRTAQDPTLADVGGSFSQSTRSRHADREASTSRFSFHGARMASRPSSSSVSAPASRGSPVSQARTLAEARAAAGRHGFSHGDLRLDRSPSVVQRAGSRSAAAIRAEDEAVKREAEERALREERRTRRDAVARREEEARRRAEEAARRDAQERMAQWEAGGRAAEDAARAEAAEETIKEAVQEEPDSSMKQQDVQGSEVAQGTAQAAAEGATAHAPAQTAPGESARVGRSASPAAAMSTGDLLAVLRQRGAPVDTCLVTAEGFLDAESPRRAELLPAGQMRLLDLLRKPTVASVFWQFAEPAHGRNVLKGRTTHRLFAVCQGVARSFQDAMSAVSDEDLVAEVIGRWRDHEDKVWRATQMLRDRRAACQLRLDPRWPVQQGEPEQPP